MPVVVGIIDSNDHGPRFSMSQYNASIAEDAAIGANVLAVQAVDLDAVSFVYYKHFNNRAIIQICYTVRHCHIIISMLFQ